MAFQQAMTQNTETTTAPKGMTYTENGALAHVTDSQCLKFFTTVMARDKATAMSDDKIKQCLSDSWSEDPALTLRLVAHLRDCREGKGERHATHVCLQWLLEHHQVQVEANYMHLPFYGRWCDLVQFFTATPFQAKAMQYLAAQLKMDLAVLQASIAADDAEEARTLLGQLSLAAKWAPSEKCTYDKQAIKAKYAPPSRDLAVALDLLGHDAMQQLRTMYLTPLRAATGVVESLLCAQRYDDIDFSKVPSGALKMYSAKCFPKHLGEKFAQWQADVLAGRSKANTSQVDPHEVVRLFMHGCPEAQKPTLEAFYKIQLDTFRKKYGSVGSTVCVVDTSGSMDGTPLEVAVALGVWIAGLADPEWDLFFTFESNPSIVDLSECKTLEARVEKTRHASWGGSTDIQATFELMLKRAQDHRLTDEEMPKRLVIISDMQFDEACGENCWTNLETIAAKFRLASYTMPEIVFWNVRGNTGGSAAPAADHQHGVLMLSGFSKNLIPIVINGLPIPTPYDVMISTVGSERYDRMTLAVESE